MCECPNSHIWYSTQILHREREKGKWTQPMFFSPPLNDCELEREPKPLSSSISLFYSLFLFAFQLFFSFSSLCASHFYPLCSITPPCLFFPLPSSFRNSHFYLSLSWRNWIQAAPSNDNNNSLKCRRRSGPLSCCPLSLSPLSSSLSFSCPSPKVAISHPFPACST